jgi:dihydropteroate synthase
MGVINVTPDSFFDGGRHASPDAAVAHGVRLARDGADILDVGGESTRPGADAVRESVEQERVLPVVERLAAAGHAVSIDTYHAGTARRSLALGAVMLNDITALRGDPQMAEVASDAGCPVVLMHMLGMPKTMQDSPRYENVVEDICAFFEERIRFAVAAGIREDRVWLDPGFGFGKTPGQNLQLIRGLREFKRFGRPILIGTSNKSTIGVVLNTPVDERTEGTAATVALAIANGADAIRVHDVKAMARVARMTDAILSRGSYE